MAPREPVHTGSVVVCGACCGLMVVDVNLTGESVAGVEPWDAYLRRPTIDERRAAHKDELVKRAIDEYNRILLTKNKRAK